MADLGTADKPGSTVAVFDLDLSGANRGIPKLVNTFQVGLRPISLSYDDVHHLMWIALYADNKIVAVDTNGKIQATLATDSTPTTVLWTGSEAWATLGGSGDKPGTKIARIAPDSSGKFVIQGLTTVGRQPTDLAWDKESRRLFVANYADNSVMVVDPAQGVKSTYHLGSGPSALAWSRGHLWVAMFDAKSVVALNGLGMVILTVRLSAEPNALVVVDSFIWAITSGTADAPAQSITLINPDDYPQLFGSTP